MAKIRKPSYARKAYLLQTLVFFDGPQVVLFKSDRQFPMIGLAVDFEDYGDPSAADFLLTEVTDRSWRDYIDQKVDLRFLFLDASKRLYTGRWTEEDGHTIPLKVAKPNELSAEFLPDHGFWSRNHTIELDEASKRPTTSQEYAIDGTWDASDFSRFYGRTADLYAFLSVTSDKILGGLDAIKRLNVEGLIKGLAWQGGGSYVGFYDRLFGQVDDLIPLRVSRIAYASPGTIELRGDEEPLNDVNAMIEAFEKNRDDLTSLYSSIHGRLKKARLLGAAADRGFPNPEIESVVRDLSFSLYSHLGVENPASFFELCGRNTLVFSKIVLSVFRRVKDLQTFHAQGRVTVTSDHREGDSAAYIGHEP